MKNPGSNPARFLQLRQLRHLKQVLVTADRCSLSTLGVAQFLDRGRWLLPLKNWTIVYLGNFIGSLIVAYFLVYLTEVLMNSPSLDSAINIAVAKTSNPFYKTFLKGIACNWMVALAMWLAYAAKDITGKILGIWFPVMAFVAMGFEHCVANMFFIPVAIFHGADITWMDFIVKNLIPATLGNIVGGALFVGTAYWYAYDKK